MQNRMEHGWKKLRTASGFTLLEVLLAIGILATLSLTAITLLSTQMDTRQRLTASGDAYHAMHTAIERISDDLRNAWMLSRQDDQSNPASQRVKPVFMWTTDLKYFMVQNFRSFSAGAPESNFAMVRYIIREDVKEPQKKNLVRVVDTRMEESIGLENVGMPQVLLSDVKSLEVRFWNGLDFAVEKWDTTNSEFATSRLPKMAQVKLDGYFPESELDKQLGTYRNGVERPTIHLETIVYLLKSAGMPDLKEPMKEYRWR